MIPEYLHRFGEGAAKWFTGAGLLVYKDMKWNPAKGNTSSAKEHKSKEMVKEDLWGLNNKWEALKRMKSTDSARPDTSMIDTHKIPTTEGTKTLEQTRLGCDNYIASFQNVYNRTKDNDNAREEEKITSEEVARINDITGTQFEFSSEQLE
jgi:hypothetical protein